MSDVIIDSTEVSDRQDPDKINIYSDIDGSKISAVIEIPFILLECSYIRFELRR